MSLQPKIKVLSQDATLYSSITVKDDTGTYDAGTNPGGFGTPNPLTTDVQKMYLQEEYMGDDTPGVFEEVDKLGMLADGVLWEHPFREGVTKLNYLIGFNVGLITALKGNLYVTLSNADTLLLDCTHIEIDGTIYQLDGTKPATSTQAFLTTPVLADYVDVNGYKFYSGYTYTLWNEQGKMDLVHDIANVSCTSIACGAIELEYLMVRYRFYLSSNYYYSLQNYSKAHNLAVMLSPELSHSNCVTC